VVEEQRQERVAQAQEAAAQRRAEIAALHEGPYGAHNFKVNTMSQRLDFADYQKQRYHDLLLAYTDRITVSREEEDLDQENRQRYRDRRSELRKQFVSEVTNILEPDQAEVFAALPEFEQRPDGTARFVFATAGDAGEMNTLIEERIMGVGADGLLEPGAARLGVKVHLERAGEALEKVIRATSVSGEAGVETKDVEVEIDTLPEVAPQ
jgi:hypothetical protein